MQTRSLFFATVIAAAIAFVFVTTCKAANDPFVGTWKQDMTKIPNRATNRGIPVSDTLIITAQGSGYKIVDTIQYVDARPSSSENEISFDGKEQPVTGNAMFDSKMGVKVDSRTFDIVMKKAGKDVGTQRLVVSEDGKTLTITFTTKDAKGEEVTGFANLFVRQ